MTVDRRNHRKAMAAALCLLLAGSCSLYAAAEEQPAAKTRTVDISVVEDDVLDIEDEEVPLGLGVQQSGVCLTHIFLLAASALCACSAGVILIRDVHQIRKLRKENEGLQKGSTL